jgi:phospholipid/cholesterol/gamma-HCH transport system substrate-binding protein
LQALFTNVSSFSDTAHDFLKQNGDNIIRLGQLSRPQAQMLARYAPEYPCLLGGLVNAAKREAQVFRGFTLHIVLESLPNQPRGYTAAELAEQQISVLDPTGITGQVLAAFPRYAYALRSGGRHRVR